MTLGENKVYHMDNLEGMRLLPDKSVNLIISDPPYFEIKGDFDFVFKDFAEYLQFMEAQAKEYKRVLADNGTLFVYGHAKRIAYVQVVFDKYFNLENHIKWRKGQCQTRRGLDNYRIFAPVTEHILMYSNEVEKTGLQAIYDNPDCFLPIKKYMRSERDKLMLSKGFKTIEQFNNFINEWTGTASVVSRHYFADSQYNFPTLEIYKRLQETGFWQKEYEALRQEYEALRQEYEALRRPFDNFMRYEDVWDLGQEAHITGKFNHPTQKPETISRVMILTCTRPGDLVLIPFAGSGSECAMAIKEGRRFIGFDIDENYVLMSNRRAGDNARQTALFY